MNSLETVFTNVYKIFLLQAYRWVHGWLLHEGGDGPALGSALPPGP